MKKSVWLCFSLCGLLLFFDACKARKVAITHLDSTSVSHSVKNTDSVVVKKDTSSHKVSQVVISSDSGTTTTVYLPDSGKFITVEKDSITGVGKIVKTHHYVKHQTATKNVLNQSKQNDSTSFHKAQVKSDSVHVDKKTKIVVATPTYGWIIYVAIGIAVLLLIIFILWKVFKPKML